MATAYVACCSLAGVMGVPRALLCTAHCESDTHLEGVPEHDVDAWRGDLHDEASQGVGVRLAIDQCGQQAGDANEMVAYNGATSQSCNQTDGSRSWMW
jgi:hypothetical protein